MVKRRSLLGGAAANVAGRGWLIAVNLAIVPIYLRLLGVEAYGLVGILVSFQAIMSIMDVGLGPTLSRALARKSTESDPHAANQMHDWVKTVSTIVASTNTAFALVVALSSAWLATTWFNPKSLGPAPISLSIKLMGIIVAGQFFSNLCTNGIQALERQGLANLINSAATTVRALATIGALLAAGRTLPVFFCAQAAVALLQATAAYLTLRAILPRPLRPARFDPALLRSEWRFALGSTGISLISIVVVHVDKIVVTRLFALSEFGYYSIASSLANATPILVTPIVQACYPRFCALHATGDEAALRPFYQLSSQWITVALAGPAATVVVFASSALLAWTGNPDVAAKASLTAIFLTLGNFLSGQMNGPYTLSLAYGKTRLFLFSNALLALLLVPAMVLLVPRFGAAGAALSWLSFAAAAFVIVAPLAHRATLPSETWRWPLQDVIIPTLAAFAGALLVRVIPWPGGSGSRAMAFARVVLGFVIATAAALLTARQAAASARHALSSRFARRPVARA